MNKLHDKKSKFQPADHSRKIRPIAIWVAAALLLCATVLYLTFADGTDQTADAGAVVSPILAGPVTASSHAGRDFRIPVSEVSDGTTKFYNHTLGNKNIRFFVIKSSDGVIRAAFDACLICYEARRGYRQQGEDVICNKCNRRFRLVNVNVKSGGCNPIPLTRSVEGNSLVIRSSDLEQGTAYF